MTTPLLAARDLARHFPVGGTLLAPPRQLRAVDGVSFELFPGEVLGLAGESGCGKSTVARLLMGLTPPTSGSVLYEGNDLATLDRRGLAAFRRDVQMIFQDPFSSLNPRMRVGDIIGEPLLLQRTLAPDAIRERVLAIMARVGLAPHQFHRYPHEFSGGQRQRIGIARTLATSPRLIVADEPVSALDLSIQAQIVNLLQDLKRELSLSFLFIAHDLSVVRHMSDRIAVMYLGRIVEIAPGEQLFARCRHPYTEALLSAIPSLQPDTRKHRIILQGAPPSPAQQLPGCPFAPRCPYVRDLCRTETPLLAEQGDSHRAACHFSDTLYGAV